MLTPTEQAEALEAEADRAVSRRDLVPAERLLEQACTLSGGSADRWMKLAMVKRSATNLDGALAAIASALAIDPLAFVPLLLRSFILSDLGRIDEAGEAASAAVFQAPPPERLPLSLRAHLDRARRLADAHADRRSEKLTLAAAPARASEDARERSRIDRFISNAVRLTRPFPQNPTDFHFPGLPVVEFFDSDTLPWLADLAAATRDFLEEFEGLIAREAAEIVPYVHYQADLPLAQWRSLNHSDRWSAIHLIRNGELVERNARYCPRTLAAFGRLDQPKVAGCSPNLMFSLLAPGTRIPPHTGVANTRLVVHVPLVVPPACGFRVGAETREWQVGRPFAFDDTIEHEAWNESEQPRVVLIGDIWRPELSQVERTTAAAVMGVATAPESSTGI